MMKTATATLTGARISKLKSMVVLDRIRNRNVDYAKKLLNGLLEETRSINGKQYTKTAQVLLKFIESAEANAKQKSMDTQKLFIQTIKADKGEKNMRGRSRWRLRGRKAKSTNVQVVLGER